MMLMACFTILYEYQRCEHHLNSQWWSLAAITILLIGIFGVIFIPEDNPVHYVFGGAVFFAMLGFMVGHTAAAAAATLRLILYAQILFMILTVIGLFQGAPIFIAEALFILNFAVFYVYLHFHFHTLNSALAPTPMASSSASCA